MLKVLDMLAMQKSGPQPTYEAIAQQEFMQGGGSQKYPFLPKVTQQGGQNQGAPQQQQTAWGLQKQTGFGNQIGQAQQPSQFGQQQLTGGGQQTPFGQQNSAFGQNAQKPMFGGTQTTTSAFGANTGIKPTFGQPGFGQQTGQTSLFGGQQQQTAPQFGQQQQQQQLPFGQQTQTPAFGGSTFGQPQAQANQGLFGGGQPATGMFGAQPAAAATGGLFGNTQGGIGLGASGQQIGGIAQQQNPAGTLFGGAAANKPAQPTTGIFGATAQQQPTGGLFGAAPPQNTLFGGGGGTFGANAAAPQKTGGLFGATPLGGTQQQPATGGLFGGGFGAGQQTTGGLFGQPQQAQPTGMFSLNQQQQQPLVGESAPGPQAQQIPNPYGDPTKLADPFSKASYLQGKSPFENAESELQKIQEDIYKSSAGKEKDPYKDITPLDRIRQGLSNISQATEEDYVAPYIAPQNIPSNQERTHQKSLEDKFASKFKQHLDQKLQFQSSSHQAKIYSVTSDGAYNGASLQKPLQGMKTFGTDSSLAMSRQGSMQSDRKDMDQGGKLYFKGSAARQDSYADRRVEDMLPQFEAPSNEDILQIEVLIPSQQGFSQKTEFIKIHKTREVQDLYNSIKRLLEKEGRITQEILDFKLVSKGSLLGTSQTLKQAGIDKNTKVSVIYEKSESSRAQNQSQMIDESDSFSISPIEKSPSIFKMPSQLIPTQPKIGYQTLPTWGEIQQMTDEQLRRVSNFTIFNQYGQIEFIGDTDLTNVDLYEAVSIQELEAEVYDEKKMGARYPQVGQKLNRPALISFFDVKLPANQSIDQFCDKLRRFASQKNGQHISYNEQQKQWTIRVEHFTNYKFNLNDDEPDQKNPPAATRPQERNQTLTHQTQPLSTIPQQNIESQIDQPSTRKYRRLNYNLAQQPIQQQSNQMVDDVMSETLSQAMLQQQQLDDDVMIDLVPQTTQVVVAAPIAADRDEISRLKREEVKRRIARRHDQIQKIGAKLTEKPSLQESLQYLKELKVQVKEENKQITGLQQTPLKVNRCRPQFRPDGALLTVKRETNQVQIREIPTVQGSDNSEQRAIYSGLTDIFLKYTTINEGKKASIELRDQLDKMKLSQQEAVRIDQSADPKLRGLQQANQQFVNYEDTYIQDCLSNTQLPFVTFKKDPKDLFFFFESLTKHLVSQIHSQRVSRAALDNLTQEFYVVCTLNALFGNPNIPLVQLHNSWRGGMRTYDKLRDKFAQNFQDSHSHEVGKKRRNALIDVLRFICMQEHKVEEAKDEKGIYQQAVGHLTNGDIRSAVTFLNSKQKTSAAMIVSNAFSSQLSIQAATMGFKDIKADSPMRPLIDFLQGNSIAKKTTQMTWIQALLYQLLVRSNPNENLQQVVQTFAKDVYDKNYKQPDQTPILWLLVRFYGLNLEEADDLNTKIQNHFNVQSYSKGDKHVQNHRLQFLISLTLFNLNIYIEEEYHKGIYQKQYSKFTFLHDRLYHFTILYINQLMRNQDWRQALLVSHYIPVTFKKQRKQIVFQILQAKSMLSLKELDSLEVKEVQDFIFQKLHMPLKVFSICRAIQYQYLGKHESALSDWLQADNHNMAHSIFMSQIAPLYFTPILQAETHSLLQNKDSENTLKDQINSFDTSRIYQDYKQQCFLITSFFKILNRLRINGESREALDKISIQNIAKDLSPMNSSHNLSLTLVKRFIWEKLIQVTSRQELSFRGREDLSGFADLVSVYPDSPQLSRFYDEVAIQVNARNFCSDIRSGIYAPISNGIQMEGISE